MFIRYFADTSSSPLGNIALDYMRGFMRVAPVRLVSMSGGLDGRWLGYEQLLATPMLGDFINAVCVDPSRWTWTERIPVQAANVDQRSPAFAPEQLVELKPKETIVGKVELYTKGKKNVLFAPVAPRTPMELEAAANYEVLVLPSVDRRPWSHREVVSRQTVVVPVESALKSTAIWQGLFAL